MQVIALERYVNELPEPDDEIVPGPFGQIEIEIGADTPMQIETTLEGGVTLTYHRMICGELVSTALRFSPSAAANLVGGLYRALQSGRLDPGSEGEPPAPG